MKNSSLTLRFRDFSKKRVVSFTQKGFTLIETMVAVTIIALAIAGPLTTASRAIVAGELSRDQFVASYLAQEGIEYVRAMRDDEFLALYPPQPGTAATAWNNFLNGVSAGSIAGCRATTCTLDPAKAMNQALASCSGSACTPLYLSNGIYTQQSTIPGSVKTSFTRTIQAFTVSANEEQIVSTVSWTFHGTAYSVTTSDHLTSWQ